MEKENNYLGVNKIEFKNVVKTFGEVKAVNGLNLTILEGEVYAFLGHNGSGKTTTLRLLLGLFKPEDGSISIFGYDPIKNGEIIRSFCGVLSEDVGLYEPLSVYDNLIYYTDIYGLNRADANKRIDELLKKFDILDKKFLPVKGFSTGMKKKVALIRAMIHKPRILLLDEPTNGLDPVSTTDLRHMLFKLAKEEGTTIIMTTHNLEEVQKICDKISILKKGKNIFTDSIKALKKSTDYHENGEFSLEKLYLDIEHRGNS